MSSQTVQIYRNPVNTAPVTLLPGVLSAELGPFTRLWIGAAGGNRLLLSSNPADTPVGLPAAGGTVSGLLALNGGLSFAAHTVASPTDLSRHIALFGTTFGLSITTNRQNYVAATGSEHAFVVGGADVLWASQSGATVQSRVATPATLTLLNSAAATPLRLAWDPVGLTAWDMGTDTLGQFSITNVSGGKTVWQVGTGLRQFWYDVNGVAQMTLDTTGILLGSGPTLPAHATNKTYVDTKLPLSGGSLTGPLVLAGDPTVPLGAATRQYADRFLPLVGGALSGPLYIQSNVNDPLQLTVPAGGYARMRTVVAGARIWSMGTYPDGSYGIADETAPLRVFSLSPGGNAAFTGPVWVSGGVTVGAEGVAYAGIGPGGWIAYGSDSSGIQAYANGAYYGVLATQQWVSASFPTAAYVSANYASIPYVNATFATPSWVESYALPLSGGTITGDMGINGTVYLNYVSVFSAGIKYTGVGGDDVIAFGWDGAYIQGYVDGTYVGDFAPRSALGVLTAEMQELRERLVALETWRGA